MGSGSHRRSPAARRVRGFSLIEALVALLVLSIGLLGVAGMQLKAMQSTHAGYQRAIASLAAQDAVELIWAEVDKGNGQCPSTNRLKSTHWVRRWQTFLPGVQFPIVSGPGADCFYRIQVKWTDQRFERESPPALTYEVRFPRERTNP